MGKSYQGATMSKAKCSRCGGKIKTNVYHKCTSIGIRILKLELQKINNLSFNKLTEMTQDELLNLMTRERQLEISIATLEMENWSNE